MHVIELDGSAAATPDLVGGKGAGLAALARTDGVRVPPAFCVTATAGPDEVTGRLARDPDGTAYAVRSSATDEDTGTASFAGLHDTELDVVGPAAVLAAIDRVRASLRSPRGIAYRAGRGGELGDTEMAVVVQRMVRARASGVVFTADPLTGHRRTTVVEAVRGLGDALVAGRVEPERLVVRDGQVLERRSPGGPVLTGARALELAALGRRVEAALGAPQDLEWCLDDEGLALVQARPITTLFPIPEAQDDDLHVYVSVGHQQMFTDPMTPLGLSTWRARAMAPMHEAGSRLFVDVARPLATAAGREALLEALGRDPLVGGALRGLLARGDLGDLVPAPDAPAVEPPPLLEADPAVVAGLVARAGASVHALEATLAGRTGTELMERISADVEEHRRVVFDPLGLRVVRAAIEAQLWLHDHLGTWLGEPHAADALARSVPGDPTAEMGLALLDVADAIRDGEAPDDALRPFLDAHGMRGEGEIDIGRPRWREEPATLLPTVLAHVRDQAPGEARRRVLAGERAAEEAAADVLARVRELPDGAAKAAEAQAMIARVRTFGGFRELPKLHIVSRLDVIRTALLAEGGRLAAAGVLEDAGDVVWLDTDELADAVREGAVAPGLVARRRREHAAHARLTPPRVMTSEGEVLTGSYDRAGLPAGALAGIAVSAGTVEGRARVVHDLAEADLRPGDVLVTRFTDPGWTPLLVAATGLVCEVGGLMSHGAVIAREYGLPAVVNVEGATRRIPDGARVRVHGSAGWVELL